MRFLLRLSLLYRKSPQEIFGWPASHVKLLRAYLQHEMTPEERIEWVIARFAQRYVAMHMKAGAKAPPLSEFLPPRIDWERIRLQTSDRYGDASRRSLAVLMSIGRGSNR